MSGNAGDLLAIGSVFAAYLVGIGCLVFGIVSLWRILEKGGRPGWPATVPVYGTIQLLRLIDRPVWWVIAFLLPGPNLVFFALVCLRLAKAFGRGSGFAVGLMLLHFVFLAILAFGPDRARPQRAEPRRQKSLSKP